VRDPTPMMLLLLGVNTLFWTAVGVARYLKEHLAYSMRRHHRATADPIEGGPGPVPPRDVAILIPAHNEAAVLEDSLRAASTLVPVSQIHLISDGSTDRTADIGREFGVQVLELSPNRGKAGALLEGYGTSNSRRTSGSSSCSTPTQGSPRTIWRPDCPNSTPPTWWRWPDV